MAKKNEELKQNVENEELKDTVDTKELEELKAELEKMKAENEELKENQEKRGAYKKGSYMVYTPVKNFNGIVAGVQFAYGKANIQKGWILDWFKERGYKVEEVK